MGLPSSRPASRNAQGAGRFLSGISRGLPFRTSAAPLAATDAEMFSTPSPSMPGTELWRRYFWTNQPSLKQIDFPSTVHLASDEAGTPI
ncbi:hypothetical protein XH92_34965 [Bradyrhizobium sp. CCBAU 53421]|nr:hypothetical protein XH92_34965 [Bradyrhizobium sp. CCBAU 53421]